VSLVKFDSTSRSSLLYSHKMRLVSIADPLQLPDAKDSISMLTRGHYLIGNRGRSRNIKGGSSEMFLKKGGSNHLLGANKKNLLKRGGPDTQDLPLR
jgi:hypothetical protein